MSRSRRVRIWANCSCAISKRPTGAHKTKVHFVYFRLRYFFCSCALLAYYTDRVKEYLERQIYCVNGSWMCTKCIADCGYRRQWAKTAWNWNSFQVIIKGPSTHSTCAMWRAVSAAISRVSLPMALSSAILPSRCFQKPHRSDWEAPLEISARHSGPPLNGLGRPGPFAGPSLPPHVASEWMISPRMRNHLVAARVWSSIPLTDSRPSVIVHSPKSSNHNAKGSPGVSRCTRLSWARKALMFVHASLAASGESHLERVIDFGPGLNVSKEHQKSDQDLNTCRSTSHA